MTPEIYKKRIDEIEADSKLKKRAVLKEFVDANNPYKLGDVITDTVGSIKIESINYSHNLDLNPCAVFYGSELRKDGKPKVSGDKRFIWQSNIINK